MKILDAHQMEHVTKLNESYRDYICKRIYYSTYNSHDENVLERRLSLKVI